MFKLINEKTVKQTIQFPELIDELEKLFTHWQDPPLRTILNIPNDQNENGTMLIMPAWDNETYFGLKTVSIFPSNTKKGIPGLHSIYNLYDKKTGVPLATIEANPITAMRTAAISALAAKFLSRKNSETLLIVGAGAVATVLADAFSTARNIKNIIVWNRSPKGAIQLVSSLRQRGYSAKVSNDLESAVKSADIVSCATLSNKPLILKKWLKPGTHLDLIGSFSPTMRETDADCFYDTSVFIDTEEALLKSGDILDAINTGKFNKGDVKGTLANLCQNKSNGRINDTEITVFKSVGNAMEDLVAAKIVYGHVIENTLYTK